LMRALDVSSAEDLVVRINEDPVRDYASLYPVVLARAEAGDEQGIEVLESAGCELASLTETLIQRLFGSGEEVGIATHGGIFASSNQVKRSFEQELRKFWRSASFVNKEINPAMGALERARREFGVWHGTDK
jgi:N-acetylglucosamine kinase-like BadF-type ATPase